MDWNVPDWHLVEVYPRHKWPSEWHWEFLRRLPEYRNDWLNRDNTNEIARGEWHDQMRLKHGDSHHPLPEGYASLREALSERGSSADGKHREKYGLHTLFPPYYLKLPVNAWIRKQGSTKFYSHDLLEVSGSIELNEHVLPKYKVLIEFDLKESIDDQLLQAKGLLKVLQKESGITIGNRRLTPDEMIRYLRAIDAKDFGATNREIGEILRPPHIGEAAANEAKRLYRIAKRVQLKLLRKPSEYGTEFNQQNEWLACKLRKGSTT